jgi:hypothetical protein
MPITINDIMPIGLCISTQELFDTKRFRQNFCDTLLLRFKDEKLEPKLKGLKRELNSIVTEDKFFEGHKAVIVNNIDKIISLVSSRYSKVDLRLAESVVKSGREIMERVLAAENFEKLAELESVFKSSITLPVYELFAKHTR